MGLRLEAIRRCNWRPRIPFDQSRWRGHIMREPYKWPVFGGQLAGHQLQAER